MDIKKIRKAVMASMGIMSTTTDSKIREIWRSLDEDTKDKFLEKVKGGNNVTSINSGSVQGSSDSTCGDGEPPDVHVPVP